MLIRRLIELLTPENCLSCGDYNGLLCPDCVAKFAEGAIVLEGASAGAYYGGPVKELILRLKFHRQREAAVAAAELVLAGLPSYVRSDVVTFVPVSPPRFRERGYNQSQLVAAKVAARFGLPCRPLLGRSNSEHQLGVDRQTRLSQVKGAFYPLGRLTGERVLLVDDVVTTGATARECVAVLVEAGAESVWAAAVARH